MTKIKERKEQFISLDKKEQRKKLLSMLEKLGKHSDVFSQLHKIIIKHKKLPMEVYTKTYSDILDFASLLEKEAREKQLKKFERMQKHIKKIKDQEAAEKENADDLLK